MDTPGKTERPTVMQVTTSCVKILYEPPTNSVKSEVIRYIIKYRKDGESAWKSKPETINISQTITGLDVNTVYEFTVTAKYEGGKWGPQSNPVRFKTEHIGNCCSCV